MSVQVRHGRALQPAVPVTPQIQDDWTALLDEGLREPYRFDTAVAAIAECIETGEVRPEQAAHLRRVWTEVTQAGSRAGGVR